jgi:oxidoreductase
MTTRTALIGLGWSGREIWLPRLLARDDYEIVAAVDPDPQRRKVFTVSTGRPAFASIDALDVRSADLAIVAVPNHAHAQVARTMLLRGLATFVEKPVCLTGDEADMLADAERRGGVPLLAGSASRYRTDIAELVRLVPALGQPRHVDLAWIRSRGVPHSQGWYTTRAQAGGGVLVDLGWHLLDVLEAIVGPLTFGQVLAATTGDHVNDRDRAATWRRDVVVSDAMADVEDTVRGFMVAKDGLSVGLRASWASHTATHDVTSIHVEGTTGAATLRCTFGFSPYREPQPRITLIQDGRAHDVPIPAEPIGVEYDRQLEHLRHQLADPLSLGRTIAVVRRIVTTIEAMYAAATASPLASQPGLEPKPPVPTRLSTTGAGVR